MGLKELKSNFLVDVATELFLSKSISEVTIKDIATEAEVGEATIYRHFGKKQSIVVASVMKLHTIVNSEYFDLSKGRNGFEKLSIFYNSYLKIFIDRPNFYKFLNDFDAYMVDEGSELLDQYERKIDQFKEQFLLAYEQGMKDETIMAPPDIELFYFSTTHALLELCKKLSNDSSILNQDKTLKKSQEIECLINLILNSLKRR